MFNKSIFIFRRDLRLEDNIGLINALQQSKTVIPVFIFTPEQATSKNKFKSDNALQFMLESIQDLDKQLQTKKSKLNIFFGAPDKIIKKLIKQEQIDAVFVNYDYTPYSKQRDAKIESVCKKAKFEFKSYHDTLLNPPEKILKKDNTPYTIFTPFFKHALIYPVQTPQRNNFKNFCTKAISGTTKLESICDRILSDKNSNVFAGGRNSSLKILQSINLFKNYKLEHDIPGLDATTKLSAHNKFGTVSIREVYYAIAKQLGRSHQLIRQLYWRDFFTHIAFHFPEIFGSAFRKKYNKIKWENNKAKFNAWCSGNTGFPIVDAGMRELNITGFMQNRVRMIVASFLVKDLHIDWQWGERYFATKLVDYDPSVNNGNWQWCASTGCDAQPYFRIFNPWIQQKKFDPECIYIKKWIPELKDLSPKEIHKLLKSKNTVKNYPTPIIDHKHESRLAIFNFKHIKL